MLVVFGKHQLKTFKFTIENRLADNAYAGRIGPHKLLSTNKLSNKNRTPRQKNKRPVILRIPDLVCGKT